MAAGDAHSTGMQSYLRMMTVRLLEMRRVLTPTGSIYLHCDPVASHYLKLLMDAIFGLRNFRNEWRGAPSHAKLSTLACAPSRSACAELHGDGPHRHTPAHRHRGANQLPAESARTVRRAGREVQRLPDGAGMRLRRPCAAPALRALQCRYRIVSGFRGSVGLAVRTLGERSQSAAQLLMVWHPVSGP